MREKLGSNSMGASDLQDEKHYDKMRSKHLMRAQVEVERDCRPARDRIVTKVAPKTATPQLPIYTSHCHSPEVKQARPFSCDRSVGVAKGCGPTGTKYDVTNIPHRSRIQFQT